MAITPQRMGDIDMEKDVVAEIVAEIPKHSRSHLKMHWDSEEHYRDEHVGITTTHIKECIEILKQRGGARWASLNVLTANPVLSQGQMAKAVNDFMENTTGVRTRYTSFNIYGKIKYGFLVDYLRMYPSKRDIRGRFNSSRWYRLNPYHAWEIKILVRMA